MNHKKLFFYLSVATVLSIFVISMTLLLKNRETGALDGSKKQVSNFGEELPVKKDSVSDSIACPSQDFSLFLSAFSESVEMQKVFTVFPLARLDLDRDAQPEPKPVVTLLSSTQAVFPLIPNAVTREDQGRKFYTEEVGNQKVKVILRKPDTGWQLSYFFELDSCWKLTRIENWSM